MNQNALKSLSIDAAAALLRSGQVCAFPTETVYGLGADATNSDAVLQIYQTKNRPRFNPLIAHCADFAMAETLVHFSPLAKEVAERFWPGPLSLVLPRRADAAISDLVTAGLQTLAVRFPANPIARQLIAAVGKPLAAPSANPSGKLSPTSAAQVHFGFAGEVPVIDGGDCSAGLESTIIAVDGDRLIQLRAGALARGEIENAIGRSVEVAGEGSAIQAPGMLKSHYAPNASLRLNAVDPQPDEAWLGFGPSLEFSGPSENLSPTGDLIEAARNLFACLHALDATQSTRIAVASVPKTGLGEAINDRLERAAAPRK